MAGYKIDQNPYLLYNRYGLENWRQTNGEESTSSITLSPDVLFMPFHGTGGQGQKGRVQRFR